MYLIQQITADPLQSMSLNLPGGGSVSLTIYYSIGQYGWFITSLTYGTLTISGMRITAGVNILGQFCNQIPFGMMCAISGREPTQQEDFYSGAAQLYIMSASEVAQYNAIVAGT